MSDLNINVQLRAFDQVSRQLRNIRGASEKLTKVFDEDPESLRKLNNQMNTVDCYRRQERELTKVADKINQAKAFKDAWRAAKSHRKRVCSLSCQKAKIHTRPTK